MFRIPSFYKETVDFTTALAVMTQHGRGDALEGMNAMQRVWEEHCASCDAPYARFDSDSDFYECYEAEVNAYNAVFENMNNLLDEVA